MRLYDITHTLGNGSACWPGDTRFHRELTASLAGGDSVNLSHMELSPHNGTHTDAPYHYDEGGLRMHEVPLQAYIGPARLIAVEGKPAVTEADLRAANLVGVERLLIRTGSCPDPTQFNPGFTYLEPDAVQYLSSLGVRLIGVDTHSVDAFDREDLPAHKICRGAGMLILENLNLAGVPTGDYELIALPLKLEGADASPVRAVLRQI